MFFVPLFLSNLNTKKIARKIEYIRTTGSTNKTIYDMWQNNEIHSGGALITDQQTEGKGRRENQWISSTNKSLTFSFILNDEDEVLNNKISLISGIAIIDGIKKIANLDCQLKWPNDIMYKNKKLGGILIEKKEGVFIVGIGINVNDLDFEESIQNKACSIYSITSRNTQREPLLAFIFNSFENLLTKNMSEIVKKWESVCNHINTFVKFHHSNQIIEAEFAGLNKDGKAKIKINNTEKIFHSGIIEL